MTIYFTSDLHINHKNVISLCNRPFENLNDMHDQIISRWNSKIASNDGVYILGDVGFGNKDIVNDVLSQLNGNLYLIRGNHDQKLERYEHQYKWIKSLYELNIPDTSQYRGYQKIVLCHYAMRVWSSSHHGSWQLYGHSHGMLEDDPKLLSFDVGMDCHDYVPISYDDVKVIMNRKKLNLIYGERREAI